MEQPWALPTSPPANFLYLFILFLNLTKATTLHTSWILFHNLFLVFQGLVIGHLYRCLLLPGL
ncbi:hypothetical protein BDW67DRAFT_54222 [Aspergillus spinulosporus]